ncbi:MAG: DUF4234 domain-containing protein [Myxococcales bacterium]|nr:DUF4234 domain-containing protein [Myxococcales bacterium]
MTTWILAIVTCGLYPLYWWYTVSSELKNYLGDEELNPTLDVVLCMVTCGLAEFLYMPIKYGKLIQAAQQRAGMADAEDQGIKFLLFQCLCFYGYVVMQEELNKVWTGGGSSATSG